MKKLLVFMVVLGMLLTMIGCTPDTSEQPSEQPSEANEEEANVEPSEEEPVDVVADDVVINVILKQLGNNYWQQAKLGAEAAGQDLGITVNVLSPITAGSNDEQLSLIEQSLAQGVDAICLSPNDSAAIVPACQNIMEQGVPLVNMATRINEEAYDVYIGIENFKLGNQGTAKICELGNNEGTAIIIEGSLGQQNSIDRAEGSAAAFKEAGVEVVARQAANWQRTEAMALVQNLLQEFPDVKYIFACNDEMALGAYEAVAQLGKTDILICGVDASPEAVQAVADGKLAATCLQDSFQQAYQTVEMALEMVNGNAVEEVMLPGVVVTADNAAQYLK